MIAAPDLQPALGAVCLGAWQVLQTFGVTADAFAGHSYGELVALCAAGAFDPSDLHHLSRERGRLMASFRSEDAGAMLAVHAPLADVEAALGEEKLDLVIANRNSPTQCVLSGSTAEVAVPWPSGPISERREVRREIVALYDEACRRLDVEPRPHA